MTDSSQKATKKSAAAKKVPVKKAPVKKATAAQAAAKPASAPKAEVKTAAPKKAAPKKAAPKKATPKQAPTKKGVTLQPAAATKRITHEARWRMIAEAAYWRAEARGFMGDNQVDDWLAAERDVDAQLASDGIKVVG